MTDDLINLVKRRVPGMDPELRAQFVRELLAATDLIASREAASCLNDEREAFEVAAYDHYLAERAKRDIPGDFEVPTTREGLLWRHPNGSYGVLLYNAAWWAWQERAAHAARAVS